LGFDASERNAPVAAPVTDAALRDAAAALTQAAAALVGLVSHLQGQRLSTNFALASHSPASSPATVAEAINAFLVAKSRAAKSDRYLRAMKNSLSKFARGRGGKLLDAVTPDEMERWLDGSDWSGVTRRGYLRDVRTLYNFAARRGMAAGNPARLVELPSSDAGPIQVHTPEQVRAVLEYARKAELNLCRALAVRYFAGLRSAECDRLTEDCIRLDTGFIEVTAQAAKTRRRRLVVIRDNLKAWLALGGRLPLRDVNNRMRLFVKAAGVPWPHNVTRHSFVSYHLAAFESAAKTALEAGHSEAMLFQHYRAVVTPQDAADFWSIKPALP
jgi:site-specific recombinase XerD